MKFLAVLRGKHSRSPLQKLKLLQYTGQWAVSSRGQSQSGDQGSVTFTPNT